MRRFLFSVLLIIGSFVLQTTLFQALSFGGIVPNLMIVLTASYGFMRGKKAGLLTGFFSGLLCDIFFGSVIGLNALIYMYIGYLNGQFHHIFYPDDIKLPLISIFVSDLSAYMPNGHTIGMTMRQTMREMTHIGTPTLA